MAHSSQKRDCPAVGRAITASKCGAYRNYKYDCPESCPYNPLSPVNYDQLQKVEDAVDLAAIAHASELEALRPQASAVVAATQSGREDEETLTARVVELFFVIPDGAEKCLFEVWGETGFPGLGNDERVLAKFKGKSHVALLEVLQVIDERRLLVRDLLGGEGEPFLFLDQSLARTLCRFETLVAVVYPTPFYRRMQGFFVGLLEVPLREPREVWDEISACLGAPSDARQQREWALRNLLRIAESIRHTDRERQRRSLLGSPTLFAQLDYELLGSYREAIGRLVEAGCESDVLDRNEVDQGFAEAAIWPVPDGETAASSLSRTPGLGTILTGQRIFRLVTEGGERCRRLRAAFEESMGGLIRFAAEMTTDVSAQEAARIPPSDRALVAESLLEGVPSEGGNEAKYPAAYYRDFLDLPAASLEGKSPRQASVDDGLRPRLLRLVKGIVRSFDRENLARGRRDDINWMLRELGLAEIDFPAPPKRILPPRDSEQSEENESLESLPVSLPIDYYHLVNEYGLDPRRFEAVQANIASATKQLASIRVAREEMARLGCHLSDDFFELMDGYLSDVSYSQIDSVLLLAWMGILPNGKRVHIAFDRVEEEFHKAFDRDLDSTVVAAFRSGDSGPALELSQEPEALLFCIAQLRGMADEDSSRRTASRGEDLCSLAILVAATNLLHEVA